MTETTRYDYWAGLVLKPGMLVDPEYQGAKDGFWRMIGARTKADYPVAIWQDGQSTAEMLKIGRKAEFNLASTDGQDFLETGWTKCEATSEEAYRSAIDSGYWPDGKPSRIQTDAAKLGVDLGDGASGGNAPPPYELLSQQLDELVEKARALEIKDKPSADAAKILADRIMVVWGQADKERDKEKRPHDEASKGVQAKWQHHMTPAATARETLNKAVQKWLSEEQRKADQRAAEETQRRQEEAQRQFDADLTDESLSDDEFAEKWGRSRPTPPPPTKDGEEAQTPEPAPVIEVAPVIAEKVTAGGAFTRNTSAKKVKVAKIVDMDKLYAALKDSEDFMAFMQKKADASMRAKIKLPGVEVVDE